MNGHLYEWTYTQRRAPVGWKPMFEDRVIKAIVTSASRLIDDKTSGLDLDQLQGVWTPLTKCPIAGIRSLVITDTEDEAQVYRTMYPRLIAMSRVPAGPQPVNVYKKTPFMNVWEPFIIFMCAYLNEFASNVLVIGLSKTLYKNSNLLEKLSSGKRNLITPLDHSIKSFATVCNRYFYDHGLPPIDRRPTSLRQQPTLTLSRAEFETCLTENRSIPENSQSVARILEWLLQSTNKDTIDVTLPRLISLARPLTKKMLEAYKKTNSDPNVTNRILLLLDKQFDRLLAGEGQEVSTKRRQTKASAKKKT